MLNPCCNFIARMTRINLSRSKVRSLGSINRENPIQTPKYQTLLWVKVRVWGKLEPVTGLGLPGSRWRG